MEFKEFIKKRRQSLGLSMLDVANATEVSEGTVSRWESGDINDIKRSKLSLLAKVLKVKPSSLIDDDFDEIETITTDNFDFIDLPKVKIPLLGTVACGTPTLAEENIIDYIEPIEFVHADYALIAKGDSMINADIQDGDIVFVKQTNQVDNGQIAVVLIENEATLKRFRKTKDTVMLIAENNEIDPIILTEEDDAKIIGLATHITKTIK